MEKIKISELHPAGSKLFIDSESFLEDLTDTEAMAVQGGEGATFGPYLAYGQKLLEYGLIGFAINNIASIAKSFSAAGVGAGAGAPAAPAAPGGATAPGSAAAPTAAATHASSVPGLSGSITYKL